jgi:hypothetical protein
LSAMEAVSHELALRYLLELSTDIRLALLLDTAGDMIAAAPDRPAEDTLRAAQQLAGEASELAGDDVSTPLELDVTLESGAVFVVREAGPVLLCVTGPFALPGLILHDMRVVLDDLRRGRPQEASR